MQAYYDFLREIKNYEPQTIKKQQMFLEKIQTELGRPMTSVLKSDELEQAIITAAQKRKRVWNGGHLDEGQTMKYRLGLASVRFYRWAYGNGYVDRNPYTHNTFRQPTMREAHFISDEQIKALFSDDRLTVFDHTVIRLMLDTGIRREELCKMKLSHIDFDKRIVHIPEAKMKKFRRVPFSENTLFWLEMYLSMRIKHSDYIFPSVNKDSMLHPNKLGQRMQKISKMIGFRISCHMFRHTAGRLWAEANVNQGIIARYLGHSDDKMTMQYIHASTNKLSEILDEVRSKNKVVFKPIKLRSRVKNKLVLA